MKRSIIFACFILSVVASANAQSLGKLLGALKANPSVEHQAITKEMMGMMAGKSDSTSQKSLSNFIQRVEAMDVYTLEDYQDKKADAIIKELGSYKDGNGFETLIAVNEGKDRVRIVAHKEGDAVSEVAIIVQDDKDIVLVRFAGKLTLDDLQSIVNEQKGKFQKQ